MWLCWINDCTNFDGKGLCCFECKEKCPDRCKRETPDNCGMRDEEKYENESKAG